MLAAEFFGTMIRMARHCTSSSTWITVMLAMCTMKSIAVSVTAAATAAINATFVVEISVITGTVVVFAICRFTFLTFLGRCIVTSNP